MMLKLDFNGAYCNKLPKFSESEGHSWLLLLSFDDVLVVYCDRLGHSSVSWDRLGHSSASSEVFILLTGDLQF